MFELTVPDLYLVLGVYLVPGGVPAQVLPTNCGQNHRRLWKCNLAPTSLRAVKTYIYVNVRFPFFLHTSLSTYPPTLCVYWRSLILLFSTTAAFIPSFSLGWCKKSGAQNFKNFWVSYSSIIFLGLSVKPVWRLMAKENIFNQNRFALEIGPKASLLIINYLLIILICSW